MPEAPSARKFLGSLAKALFSPGMLWAYLYWTAIGTSLFCLGWTFGFQAGVVWNNG